MSDLTVAGFPFSRRNPGVVIDLATLKSEADELQ